MPRVISDLGVCAICKRVRILCKNKGPDACKHCLAGKPKEHCKGT